MKIRISLAFILLFITAFYTKGLAKEMTENGSETTSTAHSCYVCLPPGISSVEAKEALLLSSHETQQQIPDCATFASNMSTDFIFPCPSKHVGRLIRIQSVNESRLCGQILLNDCKQANKMEHCYYIICRAKRTHQSRITKESEREIKKVWESSETDDEDLLQKPSNHLDKMQDDGEDVGSGEWEPPPGVILLGTTTPKPTLIPNLRPDSRTTTPIPTGGVESFSIRLDMWLVFSVLSVVVLI